MDRKDAETSLGSYRRRAEARKKDAIKAINEGNIEVAIDILMDVYQLQAVAAEYEFILDSWMED